MRVLFIGGTKRGYMTAKALFERGIMLAGIISLKQDDHEIERYESQIEALAKQHSVPHYLTKSMSDRDYVSLISSEIRPDLALVVGCRILIPKEIYQLPLLGTLAVHDSLLPEYRGFAPLNWALIGGERETGVTLFRLDERMDGGDIVGQERVAIGVRETAPHLYERICEATVSLVLEACDRIAQNTAKYVRQDYDAGSFTCSRTPTDGMIDWTLPTREIDNQVRALTYPYPGAFTFYKNEKLTIWKAEPADLHRRYSGRIPGRVVTISKADGYVDVLTGDGILRLLDVQPEHFGRAPAANVITSIRGTLGLNVIDLLDRIKVLERELSVLASDTKSSAPMCRGLTENKRKRVLADGFSLVTTPLMGDTYSAGLERVLGMPADFWLRLQLDWDFWHAMRGQDAAAIAQLQPLHQAG